MDLKFKDNSQLRFAPFTQLEYIESTGTQYIDTGVIQSGTNYLIEIEFSKTDTTSVVLMNDNNNITGGEGLMVVGQPSNGTIRLGKQYLNEWTINDYNKHYLKLEYTNGSVTLTKDNTSVNKGAATNPIVPYTIYVFANKRSGNITGYNNLKLYSFHVKVDDNEVNLIPCKDLNDVVCLYDTVSKTFLYNQGTGDFIAGPISHSTIISLPEPILLKTTTLYHKNTPNINGLQFLNSILNYQKTHQDEIKEYYYPTTQLWQNIITEYPDILYWYNINHKFCIYICEADDPEQCAEDFLDAVDDIQQELEDYPNLIPIIVEWPPIIHSLTDTGYENVLQTDGSSYIATSITPQNGLEIDSIVYGNSGSFYGVVHQNNAGGMWFMASKTQAFMVTYDGISYTLNSGRNEIKQTYNGSLIVNNVNLGSKTGTASSSHTMIIFGHFDIYKNKPDIGNAKLSILSAKLNSTTIATFIPFYRGGHYGMLDIHDLSNLTFYPNAGTGEFTYSLEPKNA